MAIRGRLAAIQFFPKDYDSSTDPLYAFQNYFPETRDILGILCEHNSFTVGPITQSKGSNASAVQIDFIGTAANVDLVEQAIENSYVVLLILLQWGFAENIDDPGPNDFNIYDFYSGHALTASSDFTTVNLTVAEYNNSQTPDLPWRKIPWTILGPLSFRR